MTTVHATTATQKTVDGPSNSKLILLSPKIGLTVLQRTGEEVELPLPTSSPLLPELLRWDAYVIWK